jgi:hypothetical protein
VSWFDDSARSGKLDDKSGQRGAAAGALERAATYTILSPNKNFQNLATIIGHGGVGDAGLGTFCHLFLLRGPSQDACPHPQQQGHWHSKLLVWAVLCLLELPVRQPVAAQLSVLEQQQWAHKHGGGAMALDCGYD